MNSYTGAPEASFIFNVNSYNFERAAIGLFHHQFENNKVYRQYCQRRRISPALVQSIYQVPFLPVGFFKTQRITTFEGEPEIVFSSSGTTGANTSRHHVKSRRLYEDSFSRCFAHFYGDPSNYTFLCLLPSYLEREGSSLIYMAEKLVERSGKPESGFYLQAAGKMADTLEKLDRQQRPVFLLGVTYALLDFAEDRNIPLNHCIMMETGGMKGRRKELTRAEVHARLCNAFGLKVIHSEYGMTELLSQAYSDGEGLFRCPPWMKVFVRDEDDPFALSSTGAGLICIADLANVHSCAFIETADVGKVYADGRFEVLGRMDNSDLRGCSLLVV